MTWRIHSKLFPALCVALVLFAGIVFRAAYWPELVSSAPFLVSTTDASYHQHWARGLAFGNWTPPFDASGDPQIPSQPFFRPPGYPYFLAAVYRVMGSDLRAPAVANMALGLGSSVLLFLLARRIFGVAPALIAALLASTYWGFVYYEGMLLEPSLLFFFMTATLLSCSHWPHHVGWGSTVVAGATMGLGALVRPNLLVCVPICLGWGLWLTWRCHMGWKPAARLLAAYLGALAFTLAPAIARNYRVSGEGPILTTNGGINLYIANNPETDCMTSTLPRGLKALAGLTGSEWTSFDYPRLVEAISRAKGQKLTAAGADPFFASLGWRYMRAQPRKTLRNFATRFLLFWGPHELANNLVVRLDRQHSRMLRCGLNFPAVLALALLGLFFMIRQRIRPAAGLTPHPKQDTSLAIMMVIFIAAYGSSYLPFFIAARYRLAVVPFLLIFAGKGIWEWVALLRTRDVAMAMGLAAFVLATYGIVAQPVVAYIPDAYLWHGQQAQAYSHLHQHDKAADMYRKAIALDARHVVLHNNLGVALREAGDLEGARQAFQDAVAMAPRMAQPHANLAHANLLLNRLDEAEAHYRIAVDLRADRADWWQALGKVLGMRGSAAEAAECFRHALALAPDTPQSRFFPKPIAGNPSP